MFFIKVFYFFVFFYIFTYLKNKYSVDKIDAMFIKEFVYIENLGFSKLNLNLKVGDTIKIINKDEIKHNIISDSPYIKNSSLLSQDEYYICTFWNKGRFMLYSSLYPEMKAIIVVIN